MIKKIGVTIAFLSFINVAAAQEQKNQNLTLFTLGMESVQYSENLAAFNLSTSGSSMVNLTQRSSGYTAVNDEFGFYITTISTLSPSSSNESWNVVGQGVYQTNKREVSLTDLDIQAAWLIMNNIQFTSGLSLNRMNFSRSGFNSTAALQQQTGAVFEYSTTLLAEIGLNYDSFFNHSDGIRFLASVKAGIPLYYYVTNSNFPNTSWTSSFRGYNLHADLGVAFQIQDDFDFIILGESDYRYRPQTSYKATSPGIISLVPDVTLTIFRATAGLSWSF